MKKSSIVIIVYIFGIILGALILDIWSAETTIFKAFIGIAWTVLFVISLYFAEKKDNE